MLTRLLFRFGSVTFFLFAFTCTIFSVAQAADKKPNFLIIVGDDLGYGELTCQGNPQIPTPNIDSIAKNGIRFTSGYVSGPYCSPTRAGLLTGRYQQRFGHEFNPGPAAVANEAFGLSLQEKTLAERLKAAGYATGMFGKWHLGYKTEFTPPKRGFDEYFGFLGGAHSYLDAATDKNNPIVRGSTPVNEIDYTTDAFARETVKFIDQHKAEPWFVYLPFNAVHAPLQSIDKYLGRFTSIEDKQRRTFAAMLSAMDDGVGSVLAKLREEKLEENTLIFFFSDNGGPTRQTTSKNDPLSGFKAQVMEGGIRIPYMVQWKGHFPAAQVDDRPVIQLDITPTVMAAIGSPVGPEAKLDGVNLIPYLNGDKKEPPHDALYWRFGKQRAIRMGDWKITDMGDGAKLFNLSKDIGEKNDLATQEPDKLKTLEASWKEWNSGNIAAKWGAGGGGMGNGKNKKNADKDKAAE